MKHSFYIDVVDRAKEAKMTPLRFYKYRVLTREFEDRSVGLSESKLERLEEELEEDYVEFNNYHVNQLQMSRVEDQVLFLDESEDVSMSEILHQRFGISRPEAREKLYKQLNALGIVKSRRKIIHRS